MNPPVSIIIPTWNNAQFLNPCVESIAATGVLDGLCELIVVNNGMQDMDFIKNLPNTTVLKPGKNLGWEGGLELGLKHARGEFICFQNDDTLIPKATNDFYSQMLWPFQNEKVAAVGPTTTVASGWHSVFNRGTPRTLSEVSFLIFFTVMVRRSALTSVGGIDTSAPGGDDLDLCMRFRKAGYKVVVNPDAFIIHHAFKTGERVKGTPDKPFGWNSKEMTDRTNRWLIQKHGFKLYMETIRGLSYEVGSEPPDLEGQAVGELIRGQKIVELGCGFRKTVPQAIAVDWTASGETPSNLHEGKKSVADVQADVTKPLPQKLFEADTVIARHILEHCVETVQTLKNWNEIIKMGGRLIIAVPNQELRNTIPLNPEHVHAFTPKALKDLLELCGFKELEIRDPRNGISFIACFEKVFHMERIVDGKVLETVNA